MTSKPAVVIDNGTGYTKMGYSGNIEPQYIIPTVLATKSEERGLSGKQDGFEDLDFHIGERAIENRSTHQINYPISEGIVDNWDNMEKLWSRCLFEYLRCEPEEHYVVLTEPPLNPPENREFTAEIMFETFNVPGLYIGVQAVFALYASRSAGGPPVLTGTVVDSGDGVTHVLPVVDGYVIGSAIKHIPLAGSNVTKFVHKLLQDRREPVPPEDLMEVAKRVKEMHSYVCPDLVKEFAKYDQKPEKYFKTYEGTVKKTGATYSCEIGYERFLGPEVFFNPEIFSADHIVPLPELVDQCVRKCPGEYVKPLFKHIVLSGGSTMFKDFDRRLQRDVKKIQDAHVASNMEKWRRVNAHLKSAPPPPAPIEVNVISHNRQRFAVWFGGSYIAELPEFPRFCHTKAQYDEEGPRIARASAVFGV